MNIITMIPSAGLTRHCTARCYNSTRKKCTCICKGLLHGKGAAYARLNASAASLYLNMSGTNGDQYWPAVELIRDVQSR